MDRDTVTNLIAGWTAIGGLTLVLTELITFTFYNLFEITNLSGYPMITEVLGVIRYFSISSDPFFQTFVVNYFGSSIVIPLLILAGLIVFAAGLGLWKRKNWAYKLSKLIYGLPVLAISILIALGLYRALISPTVGVIAALGDLSSLIFALIINLSILKFLIGRSGDFTE